LKNRIIPKVETFLVKEKVDHRGSKSKSIRPPVVLALVKLYQKLPTQTFESKLPQLIKVISTALKNKDSNERDAARETMAKIACTLDMKYLPLILSDLTVTLCHGYQLHVRAATLHSILVAISLVYQPRVADMCIETASVPFDSCVPAMLDLIQQDIFGTSSEMKEADHVEKRLIKEAMGSKSQDSLEIISRLIVFKPSIATSIENRNKSSAHVVVGPFVERLSDPEVVPSTIRKVKECLNKVAIGLSSNSTADIKEVLPFIYATISPFVIGESPSKKESNLDDELENSDDEADAPLQVTKTNGTADGRMKKKKAKGTIVTVSTWAPSTLDALENQRSALEMKRTQKRNLHKVTDGVSAPKLTGSSRRNPMKSTAKLLNNPANASALIFGLTLLNSSLKRSKIDASDAIICSMADPYLPLLVWYVQFSKDSNGIVLALRCLGFLLRINLPSVSRIANELSPIVLDHLTAWGAASNTQTDIVQGCFKTLNLLFLNPNISSKRTDSTKKSPKLPLTTHQMQALISLLQSAVMESEHHNATFGLVKAICVKKYISPELYDLMDIILKLSVQSPRPSVRLVRQFSLFICLNTSRFYSLVVFCLQQSSQIFLQYLLDYPMGTQRLDNHLQQIVLNLKYEYEEGRLSAVDLLFFCYTKAPLTSFRKAVTVVLFATGIAIGQ
jgi:U3 small nucleolar RNA-associated protein 20